MLIRLLRTYLRPYRRAITAVCLLQLVQTLATLYLPTLNRHRAGQLRALQLRAAEFRYPGAEQPVLSGISLDARPGEITAIIGGTGSGKTTLVNLLVRFYEISSGRITVDGVDIASMSREQLRSLTGMVLQDAWLFGGTIADNIAYGSAGAAAEQITEAARATYVDRFVQTLPDGYDTVLDDEAANVSMGERQLIKPRRTRPALPRTTGLARYFRYSLDHKVVGIQYLVGMIGSHCWWHHGGRPPGGLNEP